MRRALLALTAPFLLGGDCGPDDTDIGDCTQACAAGGGFVTSYRDTPEGAVCECGFSVVLEPPDEDPPPLR